MHNRSQVTDSRAINGFDIEVSRTINGQRTESPGTIIEHVREISPGLLCNFNFYEKKIVDSSRHLTL